MKRNVWYSVLVIAFVVFAVITSGGCGGSSGDTVSIDSNPDSNSSLSELIGESNLGSVYGSEEYVNMLKEFQAICSTPKT